MGIGEAMRCRAKRTNPIINTCSVCSPPWIILTSIANAGNPAANARLTSIVGGAITHACPNQKLVTARHIPVMAKTAQVSYAWNLLGRVFEHMGLLLGLISFLLNNLVQFGHVCVDNGFLAGGDSLYLLLPFMGVLL